jgi:hypothetical protein
MELTLTDRHVTINYNIDHTIDHLIPCLGVIICSKFYTIKYKNRTRLGSGSISITKNNLGL